MNREIKFKVWNHIVNRMSKSYSLEQLHNEKINFTNVIFLQYIGLNDKNNKEIYEGDIIECKGNNSKEYDKSVVLFEIENAYESKFGFGSIGWYKEEIEVIGNIYENPELLKNLMINLNNGNR